MSVGCVLSLLGVGDFGKDSLASIAITGDTNIHRKAIVLAREDMGNLSAIGKQEGNDNKMADT